MARWLPRRHRITKKGRKWPVTRELDRLLRSIVLDRDRVCRKCGKICAGGRGQSLETAHIFPKGAHPSMRYRLDNVLALCHHCHFHFAHSNPVGFTDWIQQDIGSAALERLRAVANAPGRVDREADRLYLLAEAEQRGLPILLDSTENKPHTVSRRCNPKSRRKNG